MPPTAQLLHDSDDDRPVGKKSIIPIPKREIAPPGHASVKRASTWHKPTIIFAADPAVQGR